MLAEPGQRPPALERQRRLGLVQHRAVLAIRRGLLPKPVRAGADEPHVRRHALELAGLDGVQAVQLAPLDDERQLRKPRPERLAVHGRARGVMFWLRRNTLSGSYAVLSVLRRASLAGGYARATPEAPSSLIALT